MDDLVNRLSQGGHPVLITRVNNVQEFKQRIDRGYILLKFTETQGGTELGFKLDHSETVSTDADFERAMGSVHVVGDLILNYDKVRCVADIDLATLKGVGHLVPVGES